MSNCAKKKDDRQGIGERGVKMTYMFLGVLEYERVAAEDGSDEDLEFHVREVLAHTRSWAIRKRIERLLNRSLILLEPPFGPKRLHVISPNLRVPMDSITGYTQNRTLREKLSRNVQPTLGNDTRETHGRGGMQPEGFVDDGFEVGKPLSDFRGCDRVILVSECTIELLLELRLDDGIQGEVVGDSA